MNEEQILWAGSEACFEAAQVAFAKGEEYQKTFTMPQGASSIDEVIDSIVGAVYQPEGNVGIINVRGSLVTGKAGFSRLYGNMGYDDIRAAIQKAVDDKNIGAIMLYVNSPGGAVAGVQDLASFIAEADLQKPVLTYSETVMGSAALWLGLTGREVMGSSSSIMGSIGVLMAHVERSKALAEAGITATIIRSGKYKALGGPLEPLSDLAKQEMQSKVDYLAGLFNDHVAERRGVSTAQVNSKMGQGREFIGQQAVDAGLVDSITTFKAAHSKAADLAANVHQNQGKGVAGAAARGHNASNLQAGNDMKLTPEQIGMLATGTPPEQLGLSAEDLAELQKQLASAKAAADAKNAAAAAGNAAASTAAPAATQVTEFLRGELRDVSASLASTQVELTSVKAELVTAKAAVDTMHSIARAAIGNMQVALGQSNSADAIPADKLLAEHARLEELFKAKFPGGRVTATSTQETTGAAQAAVDPLLAARFKAAQKQF